MSWSVRNIRKKNIPGARANVLKKCRTSGACAQINQMLNVRNIWNKYAKCNTCPGSVRNIRKKDNPGAQANVLKKYATSGACAQINELLNVRNIWNKYANCNTRLGSVRNIRKKNIPGARANVLKKCGTSGACAKINELLNVRNIRNKYAIVFFPDIPDTPRTCITVGIFTSNILDIQQLIYLCTCYGSSAFFQDICPSTRVVFLSDIPDTPKTCIAVGIFILDILDIQQLIYLCTCSGSCVFFQDICPSTRVVFFPDIPDTPRTCITVGIFISVISDIQQVIYFCTRSGSSAFFQDIFLPLPRHVLQVAYLFRILRTFSSSFIHAHAPEVPHFFTTLSEINVPNVIHVLRVSGIFEKKKQPWSSGKCPERMRNWWSMCTNKWAAECPKYPK